MTDTDTRFWILTAALFAILFAICGIRGLPTREQANRESRRTDRERKRNQKRDRMRNDPTVQKYGFTRMQLVAAALFVGVCIVVKNYLLQ